MVIDPVTLFCFGLVMCIPGTILWVGSLRRTFRPGPHTYFWLFVCFAIPLFFVFAWIPGWHVRRRTAHKPIDPRSGMLSPAMMGEKMFFEDYYAQKMKELEAERAGQPDARH